MGAYNSQYLDDANELMRLLFEEVASKDNIDFAYFVDTFMNSIYRANMDIGSTRLINMTYDELYEFLQKDNEIKFFKKGKPHIDVLQAGWIGYMYNNIQFILKISSKELYKMLSLNDMMAYFVPLHTIDEKVAIEKIISNL